MPRTETPAREVAVRYDKTEVLYAKEFLASTGVEELLLDFSSGLITESLDKQQKLLPIQTRLALPWSTVERLAKTLNQILVKRQQVFQQNRIQTASSSPSATIPHASLPPVRGERRS
jgi:hypothetical protein